MHRDYFPDKSSGGKAKALKLAKEFRDELLAKLPRYRQEIAARKKRKAPQSGVTGVTHVISGDDQQYEFWQAAWVDENGRRRRTKFSIRRYGNYKALDMAIKARAKALRVTPRSGQP